MGSDHDGFKNIQRIKFLMTESPIVSGSYGGMLGPSYNRTVVLSRCRTVALLYCRTTTPLYTY